MAFHREPAVIVSSALFALVVSGTASATIRTHLHPGHARAQRVQPIDDMRVTALHDLERRQPALAVGRECRGNQRHSRSQVATVERPSFETAWPGRDDSVRVTEK